MSEEDRSEQETTNGNEENSGAPTSIEPVHPEPDKKGATAQTGNSKNPMTRFERVTIALAVIGTLLAIGTAVVFYDQFGEMAAQTDALNIAARQARRDSAISDTKTQMQLKLATEQTKAAQDSVKAIQRQMREDQRARIEISSSPISQIGLDSTPTAKLEIVNKREDPCDACRSRGHNQTHE